MRHWQKTLEQHHIPILGVGEIPKTQTRLHVDAMTWDVTPISHGEFRVPPEVVQRLEQLDSAGISFVYFLWAEEKPLQAVPETLHVVTPRFRRLRPATPEGMLARMTRLLDPVLIGIIPTSPKLGIWCFLGAWLH